MAEKLDAIGSDREVRCALACISNEVPPRLHGEAHALEPGLEFLWTGKYLHPVVVLESIACFLAQDVALVALSRIGTLVENHRRRDPQGFDPSPLPILVIGRMVQVEEIATPPDMVLVPVRKSDHVELVAFGVIELLAQPLLQIDCRSRRILALNLMAIVHQNPALILEFDEARIAIAYRIERQCRRHLRPSRVAARSRAPQRAILRNAGRALLSRNSSIGCGPYGLHPVSTAPRDLDGGLTKIHRSVVCTDNIQYPALIVNQVTIAMDFGSALRHFREERTLSLRELATLSGVDHAYIHRLEAGDKTAPSPDVLEKLSRGLKLTVHKRRVLELLTAASSMDGQLFELALEAPDRFDLVKVAATMSFRGARPESKADWEAKLSQIEDLLGHDRG
jgi:HTH-type transcriptional regulator, competence development regulator